MLFKSRSSIPGAAIAALLLLCSTIPAIGQQSPAHSGIPDTIDPQSRYVLYLHGQIIETQGRRPTHPAFGVYECDQILEALADEDVELISEARPAGTEIGAYAEKVAGQVHQLLTASVPADRITVVGFSKGGMIAIVVSSLVRQDEVRYVFLASCTRGILNARDLRVTGRILSIHESSDNIGASCEPLFERSPDAIDPLEIQIDTGLRHGAFYVPRGEWLRPTIDWIHGLG